MKFDIPFDSHSTKENEVRKKKENEKNCKVLLFVIL